jgi:hypothetical protein
MDPVQNPYRPGAGRRRLRRLLGVFKAFSLKTDPSGAVSLGVEVQPIHVPDTVGTGDAGQRELLRALAATGGDEAAPVANIATSMGKGRTSDISVARKEVIKKGLAYAPERGSLAFTVPGMHEFIARQP